MPTLADLDRLKEEAKQLGVKIKIVSNHAKLIDEIYITISTIVAANNKSFSIMESDYYNMAEINAYMKNKGFKAIFANPNEDSEEFLAKLKETSVSITPVDFCVAETCTLVIRNKRLFLREMSLLPEVHISVIKHNQIISTLEDALALVKDDIVEGNGITLITGPSRTADIELNLVKGVHGPRQEIMFILP